MRTFLTTALLIFATSTVVYAQAAAPLTPQGRGLTTQGRGLTLKECFERTVQRSESLAIRAEAIHAAEAHFYQALGTTLPHIDLKGSESVQETHGSSDSSAIANTFTRKYRPEAEFTVSQPLFQGLREFQALRVAGAEKKKTKFEMDRARELLFLDVARAFYGTVQLEREATILATQRDTLAKRTEELKERIALGKSREGEMLTTEAQGSSLAAEFERVNGLATASRDLLSFLTGITLLNEPLAEDPPPPTEIGSMENLLATVDSRSDIRASDAAVRLAKGKIYYEAGGHLPSINANANYYLYRTGILSDTKWDAMLNLDFPLFQGFATHGRVQEAKALWKQSQWADTEIKRRATLEIRQSYHTLTASRAREAALVRAFAAAEANAKAQSGDYRLGLVNNLDVLQALRDQQDIARQVNQAHIQARLDYFQLLVASGKMPTAANEDPAVPVRARGLSGGRSESSNESFPLTGNAATP